MKDNFEILKLDNEPYDFLIIATSYENPLNFIEEIGNKIQMKKAKLLFDLTLINGTNKNRYIKCEYEADLNTLPSCTIVENVGDSIKNASLSYYTQNEDVLRKSVIPNSLKFLLKSGMV